MGEGRVGRRAPGEAGGRSIMPHSHQVKKKRRRREEGSIDVGRGRERGRTPLYVRFMASG